jgi:hypothetical protein
VSHILIEMRRPGEAWEVLGRFRSTEEELRALRAVLEGREPFDVLEQIGTPLVRDALIILKEDGFEARVSYLEDP